MRYDFWRGRRVFITGHTGFKGSWLALWLVRAGADVTGYALPPPTQPNLFEPAKVADAVTSITGDIRDLDRLRSEMRDAEPDVVFHLAAQSLVRASYVDPVGTYATNVLGTVHVLEALRSTHARAAVIVTSDKCYENREWPWGYRENDRLGGRDPYSSSKGCSELVAGAYRHSFFDDGAVTRIATARAGNVIGGGDWASERLVPDIMRAFLAGHPVTIRNPRAIRPWQHVLEPLHGYITLAEALCGDGGPAFATSWNFGPFESDIQPVEWIVERMVATWGGDARWILDSSSQPHEAMDLRLDSSRARQRLGVSPRTDLETALSWTVRWYRGHADNATAARGLVMDDISRYEELGC